MSDRLWDLMKFNLTDHVFTGEKPDTDNTCAYVEFMLLPQNAIITKRTRYEAKSKPSSEGSENIGSL